MDAIDKRQALTELAEMARMKKPEADVVGSDSAALSEAAEQASEFLKSLANPVRLRILCLLADGEASVGEITEKLEARQSLVSQHLALLRKDGLVRPTREGQSIRYALADARVERLIGVLYETFCPSA
ncbi:DNA-binding transcriptional ArsR family regulator [Rhodoblastus acidophilus]|uniref:ArsR/SmtB family transcription factor n=1 Tax=Rhodoblastus acidophilus TaxID=1074 RepID=UPI0017B2CE06|nr:metalloregulator ArsR/SmtB family transcription factor [Rhodoblastus acidophilus]MCW2286429.1 DNA-binding transcriptional ArsR family regulator [Rhodoblastus acidophilus]MCW2335278.1 DNA-binding transcriptional ArsR family regulator [Rhodoblastus acidophilus]